MEYKVEEINVLSRLNETEDAESQNSEQNADRRQDNRKYGIIIAARFSRRPKSFST